jgi:hypothetical protein
VKPGDRWACLPIAAEMPVSKNIKKKVSKNGSFTGINAWDLNGLKVMNTNFFGPQMLFSHPFFS